MTMGSSAPSPTDLRGARLQSRKDAVLGHLAEPTTGVSGVGFPAVDDRVPVAAFRGVDVLATACASSPAIEIQGQAGAECVRQAVGMGGY